MLRLIEGEISQLSAPHVVARWLPADIAAAAPEGPRRPSWLAGRVMLAAHCPSESLQALTYHHHGKPLFTRPGAPHFNIGHSGDRIVLVIDDCAPVGVDIEILRPRRAWQRIAADYFGEAESRRLAALPQDEQLLAFWRGWTLREAVLKQRGGSVWQMAALDMSPESLSQQNLFTAWHHGATTLIAVCAAHPFELTLSVMTGV
ncbi:4'-phosphopantetheinyl transferase AcpT [Atlantibacter sp. RC6]|uniref:4'-phosphopantetheinyl transferase AcpT n=1 Tax=Atlantibacter sp. RC6 TaxID=2587036 RepID=UPI0016057869|nr:4'-phosphopantetheinyl transferase AcpT [Atlantibacter sp. RC6]MBB3322791.1 4'-phosphopantetheinyl transferase [Atlantibacter sp. RC6]